MARRTAADDRQADIFGAILPERPASKPKRSPPRQPKAQRHGGPASHPPQPDAPPEPSIDTLAARLSPADLESLATAVSDDALARLALVAVRQLRRRLARDGGGRSLGKRKGQASALDRAARQIAIELGGMVGGDEA